MLTALLRQEMKVTRPEIDKHAQKPSVPTLHNMAWWGCLLAVTIAALFVRTYSIETPPSLVWDEMHFLRFSQHYLNGTFYQDVHPPLGKMIVGAIGYLSDQNPAYSIGKQEAYQYPRDKWYITMRLGMSVFGVLQVVTSYLVVWEISGSISASYVTALLIICDCAANSYNRIVLLDPILLWFILLSVYCSVKFWSCRSRPFGARWWLWMIATGACLGLTLSVKYVGAFVVVLVGLQAAHDLWGRFCDLSSGMFNVVKHFAARCVGLIIVPILIYLSTFMLHLYLLQKGANSEGIGGNTAQFRLSFPDHNVSRHTPAVVAYGSLVTLLPRFQPTGYLSTSYDLYPPGVGAEHQLMGLDFNLDELNAWGFQRPNEGRLADFTSSQYVPQPVCHEDVVRLLNVYTERHLHTHRIQAPITKHMYQVTGFGELDEFYEGGLWRVLLDEPGAEEGVTPLSTVGSWFRLVNTRTGCVLRPGLSKLPNWGYGTWEVVCDPKGVNLLDADQLWQIDENINPKMKGEDLKERYQLSNLERIGEMHRVMLNTNSKLKLYKFEGEEGTQKLLSTNPWMWPILYRGCPGYRSNSYTMYLVGSPQVYFLNLAVLCLLPLIAVVLEVQQARHPPEFGVQPQNSAGHSHTRLGTVYLLVGWAVHYLPFWTMQRVLYFHHYLPAFFFSTMISGIVVDGLLSRVEQLVTRRYRVLLRTSSLTVLTAFFVASYLTNWELAYGVTGEDISDLAIRNHFYFDSWKM